MNPLVSEISSLRSQLDQALAEVEYYKQLCGLNEPKRARVAAHFNVTDQQASILCQLSAGRIKNRRIIFDAMPHKYHGDSINAVSVQMTKIRRKLGAQAIKNVWGSGYTMDPRLCAEVKAVMDG